MAQPTMVLKSIAPTFLKQIYWKLCQMNWNPRGGTQSLLIYSLLSVRDNNNNNNNNTKIKALLLLELELKQQETILKHLSHTISWWLGIEWDRRSALWSWRLFCRWVIVDLREIKLYSQRLRNILEKDPC